MKMHWIIYTIYTAIPAHFNSHLHPSTAGGPKADTSQHWDYSFKLPFLLSQWEEPVCAGIAENDI